MTNSISVTTISTSPPSFDSDRVAEALAAVRRRIAAAGGDVDAVRVVAVTKGFGLDAVLAARRAGLSDIGENYAAELLAKAPGPEGTSWHFLGAVQRNKVGPLAPLVSLWQGVARISEGERIARFTPSARVLVQVDCTNVAGRNGASVHDTAPLVAQLRALGLDVAGLMTVAPPEHDAADRAFGEVDRLAKELGLEERSMGMSDDLELAVAHGSTMVRIGRALFGERLQPARA